MSDHLHVIVFFLLFVTAYAHTKNDWEKIEVSDTLDILLNGKFSGSLIYSITTKDSCVVVVSNLAVSGAANQKNSTTVIEKKLYSFDGLLKSAYQEMAASSGKNSWNLQKDSSDNWILTVSAGGVKNSRKIDKVNDNLLSTYEIYTGIRSNSLNEGDTWVDTVFELTSGETVVSKTECITKPNVKNGERWKFVCQTDITDKKEIWELNKNGKTSKREMFPFVAERKYSRQKIKTREKANLFDAFMIAVPGPLKKSQQIVITMDSGLSMDKSVSKFYLKKAEKYVFKGFPNNCKGKIEGIPDSLKKFVLETPVMQISHPGIKALSDSLKKGITVKCKLVSRFNDFVFKNIRKQNTGTFSSAVETLNAGFGDCGEHSVLLAALLRAAGVPARIVSGLIYVKPKGGYYYHQWVIVYTGGEWLCADPAHGVFPAVENRLPLMIDSRGESYLKLSKFIGRVDIKHISNLLIDE